MQYEEIKPNLAGAVKAVWDDCGTSVWTMNAEASAGEIEFFLDKLVRQIGSDMEETGIPHATAHLAMLGYLRD